jgi:tetratricopeptide (TPR) repeat protein
VVSLLAGRLAFFDLGDPSAARGHLTTALDAARETGDRVLAAAALGHVSFVPAAEKNYAAAGDYLRGANAAAAKTDAPALRSWLAAVEAEVSTHAGARETALAALERAVEEVDAPTSRPLPSWFDYYDRSRLDGFRGYSYQVFGKLEAARSCLERAVTAMPERCAKQRSVVLTDLATVQLETREVEEACSTAGTAVQALQRAGYATGTHRLREFRRLMEPWKGHRAVRMLDDQMSAL